MSTEWTEEQRLARPLTMRELMHYRLSGEFDGINLQQLEPVATGETAPGRGGQLIYRPRLSGDAATPMVCEDLEVTE